MKTTNCMRYTVTNIMMYDPYTDECLGTYTYDVDLQISTNDGIVTIIATDLLSGEKECFTDNFYGMSDLDATAHMLVNRLMGADCEFEYVTAD